MTLSQLRPSGAHRRLQQVNRGKGKTNRRRARAIASGCEPLEARRLLSTINWANKGTGAGAGDTDDFNAIYGGNAATARNIVQRAIDDWERVIVDFNYAGGGNTYTLNVSAVVFAGGLRGETSWPATNAAEQPTSTSIRMDDDGGGSSWWFDPDIGTATVPDDSEFTDLVNPFASDGSITGRDFYRTILHEIGHAMGILREGTGDYAIESFMAFAGADPVDGSEDLYTINFGGGAAEYTMTTSGGGHLFEGGGAYAGPTHPDEGMNAGRAIPQTRRNLISDTAASLLRDAYGYTVLLPSFINTFYANLNTVTNVVTVTGDANQNGNNNDTIDLEVDGTAMSFEVNGTDEVIEGAQFATIVVNALEGTDDVDVDELLSGKNVTINGGNGNDNISAAQELQDIDTDLDSNFTANGDAGTDTLVFNDQADSAGADDYTINSTTFVKNANVINRVITYGTIESLIVQGGPNPSTYDINSLSTAVTTGLTINAGAANDTITVGGTTGDIDSSVNADVQVNGNGGIDTIHFNDAADDASVDDTYTLTSVGFDKSSTTEVYGFGTVEHVILTAGLADNTIDVWSMSSVTAATLQTLVVNGNDGNDAINMGLGDLDDGFAFVDVTINGQVGTDSLYLDDLTDDSGGDSYTLTSTTFDKNAAGVANWTYGTVESLTLDASGFTNVINLDTLSVPATVRGNGGDDTINIASGDVDNNILDNCSIAGNGGTDTMVFDDTTDGATQDDWSVTSSAIVKNFFVNRTFSYSTLEGVTINANAHANNYEIGSTLSTTPVTINGGAGSESFNVGAPANNAVNVDGALTLNGNGGTDALNYNDSANATAVTYTVTNNSVARTGAALTTYATMESLTINGGSAGDTINVDSTLATTPVTVNGNGGNDAMTFAAGDWDATILSSVAYSGGAGTGDTLRINDTADAGADSYTVTSASTSKSSIATTISYATVENYTLDANGAANTITVNSSFAAPFRVNGNGGADTVNLVANAAGSFVTIDGGAGLDIVNVNSDGAGVATAHFDSTQDLASLTILAGGTAVMEQNGNRLLETDALTIAASGKLDLTDNDMLLDYAGASQLAVIQALINLGRNSGAWNGNGITSSSAGANPNANTTLGAMEATDYDGIYGAGATFGGVDPDATAVLVKYTYYGDTDFSGQVDFDDYVRTDGGFNNGLGGWTNGDNDGSGSVDFDDYVALDLAFNTQGAVL